jgi:hypothetical protein
LNSATGPIDVEAAIAARLLDSGGAFRNIASPAYGAVGDGTADAAPAIASAALEGGVVWIPPGQYRLESSILLTTPVQIICSEGAEFLPGSDLTDALVHVSSSNVSLFNFHLDGRNSVQTGIFVSGTADDLLCDVLLCQCDVYACSGPGVRMDFVNRAYLHRCHVADCGLGIRMRDCPNGNLTSCAVTNTVGKGIAVLQSPACRLISCSIRGTGSGVGDGIYIAYRRSTHVVVRDCMVSGTAGSGIKLSRRAHGTLVSGCTVRKANTGPSGTSGILVQGCTHSVIDGCMITVTERHGIITAHHPHPTDGGPANNTTIRATTVEGHGGRPPAGINGSEGDNLRISDCTLLAVNRGIHIAANGAAITGCIIEAERAGISVEAARSLIVDRCRIRSTGRGIHAFSQVRHASVSSCQIAGRTDQSVRGIDVTGGGMVGEWVLTGNTITGFHGGHAVAVENGRTEGVIVSSNFISDCAAGISVRGGAVISGNYFTSIRGELIAAPANAAVYGNSPE